MFRRFLFTLLIALPSAVFCQQSPNDSESSPAQKTPKARHDQYKIFNLERDTTYVDTSLTIKSDYKYNFLRKDSFGLLPFANEGQTYLMLDKGLRHYNPLPEFGFYSKHYDYYPIEAIRYYAVATPLTELYFKTVMEQGQNVDALLTMNTSERFNFSVSYKGLRSLGKYINQLSSTGNFTFTANYKTKNERYRANFHFTGQDLLNGENGGLTLVSDFEGDNPEFKNRARLQVYLTDAKSFLKGKRFFLAHQFRINAKDTPNNLHIIHEFVAENKYFEFNQNTLAVTINDTQVQRFGEASVTSAINNQLRYRFLYNKAGVSFRSNVWGDFQVFAEDMLNRQYYGEDVVVNSVTIPYKISNHISALGGEYQYEKNKIKGVVSLRQGITTNTFSEIKAQIAYQMDANNRFSASLENLSKLPDNNYVLHQSAYLTYNWYRPDFKNQKINSLTFAAETQWINAYLQAKLFNDYLFFSDDNANADTLAVSPKQYDKAINYLSVKVQREFKYRKWALDNTVLYQTVSQDDAILNVPQVVTRNTLYFSDFYFKKALYLQTGITFNYFTAFYADDYHPILGESFVQTDTKIGGFPMLDFFINGRIRQTRIFLKAEHFNSGFTGNKYLTGTNYPYRDFMVRFGLVWNFFQ